REENIIGRGGIGDRSAWSIAATRSKPYEHLSGGYLLGRRAVVYILLFYLIPLLKSNYPVDLRFAIVHAYDVQIPFASKVAESRFQFAGFSPDTTNAAF
ncbi:hypothetical protein M8C21_024388, partial [Ambrosia artemisiifolia]